MGYMLDRYTQPYSNYTHRECLHFTECRLRYRDVHQMPLSEFDRMVIEQLLERAKRIAVDVGKAREEQAGEGGKVVLSRELMRTHMAPCRPPGDDKKPVWIRFMADEEPRAIELCELDV
eukprot:TRINITY_DN3510_c0_g1_i1.p1 TRINITY_DN3510_c0_g1~~TRINITY_DN3510_c0_g1_i1.p1  ORF type:complete len:119 (+),score=29.81 TRINITY_DN3510_c0_g1_i1:1-357(+)